MTLLELAAKVRSRTVVDAATGCWNWQGATHTQGYGQIWRPDEKRKISTHRLMALASGQSLAPGMQVDHLCRNPRCCNPAHLEVVTPAENSARGVAGKLAAARAKLVTHCPQGHEYTEANTYVHRGRKRHCRTCQDARQKARRAAA